MRFELSHGQEYEQMRGEYLSAIASMEHRITSFISCLLEHKNYPDEFQNWFKKTRIPVKTKISLLIAIIKEDSELKHFRKLARFLTTYKDIRNVLAHSYNHFDKAFDTQGNEIPDESLSLKNLKNSLNQLRYLEAYINEIQSPFPEIGFPISSDDFADGMW